MGGRSLKVNDLEWCPCHIAKWQSESVKMLSLGAQGAYWAILCLQWREGDLPADPRSIARLIGADPEEFLGVWPKIEARFISCGGGRIWNTKMAEIREEQIAKHAVAVVKAKAAADARWRAKYGDLPQPGEPIPSIPPGSPPSNAPSIPASNAPSNAQAMPLEKIREEEIREEKEVKSKQEELPGAKGKKRAWEVELFRSLPVGHQTAELQEAIRTYGQLRRERNWGPYAPVTVVAMTKEWSATPVEVIVAALLKSTKSGWQSINFDSKAKVAASSPQDSKSNIMNLINKEAA